MGAEEGVYISAIRTKTTWRVVREKTRLLGEHARFCRALPPLPPAAERAQLQYGIYTLSVGLTLPDSVSSLFTIHSFSLSPPPPALPQAPPFGPSLPLC